MEDTTSPATAASAACACGHPVGSHWEVAEPDGPRAGCGFLGCPCELVSAPAPSVNLAALQDALDLGARAAFAAEDGQDPGHVRDDLLQATRAAAAAFPDGGEAFRAMAIVLGMIAGAVEVTP